MQNSLYNQLNGNASRNGNMSDFLNQFNNFKRSFKGNPQDAIMSMLKNGEITQEQLNKAYNVASQFKNMLK